MLAEQVTASDWIQLGVGLVLLATLGVVFWYAIETRRMVEATRRMVEATVITSCLNMEIEWEKTLAAYPEYAQILEPALQEPELSEVDYRARALAGVLFAVFAAAAIAHEKGMMPPGYWERSYLPWVRMYKDLPTFRAFWQEWGFTYPETLKRAMS